MHKTILEGVVGSTAYGLATPESDVDHLAIHVESTTDLLGVHPTPKPSIQQHNPDRTTHEVGKFISLALKCNPTVTELLWLNNWETLGEEGLWLVALRSDFLSRKYIRDAYLGYATQQVRKLEDRGRFDKVPVNRIRKHARHIARLLIQCSHAWAYGEILVRLDDDQIDTVREAEERLASDPGHGNHMIDATVVELDSARTPLPETPALDDINRALIRIRERNWL